MRTLAISLFFICTLILSAQCVDKTRAGLTRRRWHHQRMHQSRSERPSNPPSRLGKVKKDFFVNGTAIPGVPFAVPDSYAGVLSAAKDDSKGLFFWLQLGQSEAAQQHLTVWLNGCSALTGALQETGDWLLPFDSNDTAVKNDYAWTKLSNMLYVDHTTLLGASFGDPVNGSEAAAKDFYVFFENFYNVFPELNGVKLWFVGEGVGAKSVDWILYEMFGVQSQAIDVERFNYHGKALYSPSQWAPQYTEMEIPAVEFAIQHQTELGLNATFIEALKMEAARLNCTDIVRRNLLYPSLAPFSDTVGDWQTFDPYMAVLDASGLANNCFAQWNIDYKCPRKVDPLGFSPDVTQASEVNFINRTPGFKQAFHVNADVDWHACGRMFSDEGDASDPPLTFDFGSTLLAYGKAKRDLIASGESDYSAIADGTALALQFTTWADAKGFPKPPTTALVVQGQTVATYSKARGLLYARIPGAGQQVALDRPRVAYTLQQYLYGLLDL